jgi:hypothetical protein
MKNEIIETLTFPREMIRGNVPLETCEHSGNFASHDPNCRVCESRIECEWLYHHDEYSGLTEKPLEALVDALQSAILYIDACISRAGHNPTTCHCNACQWLNHAQTLHQTTTTTSPR